MYAQVAALRRMKQEAQITAEAFLYRPSLDAENGTSGSVATVDKWWTFFEDVPEAEVCQ
jgi:hypothetical protein